MSVTIVQRTQTGVRIETSLLKVLKGLAEYLDMSQGDLLEGILLHVFEGKTPFQPSTLEAIERLKQAYGRPDMTFDLLAHSQGGLIARYYVKYGSAELDPTDPAPRPTMAGAASVNRLILVGTPNRGCLEAMKILHLGVKKGVRPIRPEIRAPLAPRP